MGYEQDLIERGLCPELVWVDTEDGPVTGRCQAPITDRWFMYRGYGDAEARPVQLPACEGHAEERVGWGVMTDAEQAEWEKRHDAEEKR